MSPGGEGGLRYRKLWLSIGFALVILVTYLSLTTRPIDLGRIDEIKVGHFIAYFVLMLWFAQLYRPWRTRLGIAAAFALMGVGLEYTQGLTSYRSFAYADMMDNAIGVAVGLAMASTPAGRALARIERWMGNT